MLTLQAINSYYGQSQVLFDLSMEVAAGEVVTLMGRNGMGKTTTVRSILGLLPVRNGAVRFLDKDISAWPPYRIATAGIGLVPEGRQIFPNLSVRENLIATAKPGPDGRAEWDEARIYDLFPRLQDRRLSMGNELSGGEQQMLAIGRALMTNPLLLVLDEATEGLAPLIRKEIWQCLTALRDQGPAILVIDKNVQALTAIADRHFIIEKGRIVWQGTSADLSDNLDIQHRYLGVS